MPNSMSDFDGFLHISMGSEYFNVNLPVSVNKNAKLRRDLE